MTERIENLKRYFIEEKKHHAFRRRAEYSHELVDSIGKMPAHRAAATLLCAVLEKEEPVVLENERIPFMRTVTNIPIHALEPLFEGHRRHEQGILNNISVDYSLLFIKGFDNAIAELSSTASNLMAVGSNDRAEYLHSCVMVLRGILALCDRYREKARDVGNMGVYEMLGRVPRKAPTTFGDALCFFRILHFAMWASGSNHNTVGRFDCYMKPYFDDAYNKGYLTEESALEWIEEFFLTFNRDSDLYFGVQMGDNGQSLVLGGVDAEGRQVFSLLSELCLKASCELSVIDPKINLRVDKNTPDRVYQLGTELTKKGLGFPQYSNDDVIIPALVRWGYDLKDARNYAMAACWEVIIPGEGADIPNIAALSFAACAERAIKRGLSAATSFEALMDSIEEEIASEAAALVANTYGVYTLPNPLLSLMTSSVWERYTDVTEGAKYRNYGIHGAGLATAVDSLAAVKEFVFDKKEVTKAELLSALANNYEGHDRLYHRLRYDAPKFGNGDPWVNEIASRLLNFFAKTLSAYKNDRGGIFRAGTGSAMYYVTHGEKIGATPDGRKKGEALPANYSPSLFTRCKGPVSVILSFTSPDLSLVANGGPLTLELHDSMFRSSESVAKTALLVKSYILQGGHQLQLNAVDRDTLLAARENPENYRNLIVRVWGWSGYFVELDREYQDHIIARCEYTVD